MREQARRKAVVADRAKETQAAIAEQIREKAARQKAAADLAWQEADETARRVQVHICNTAGVDLAASCLLRLIASYAISDSAQLRNTCFFGNAWVGSCKHSGCLNCTGALNDDACNTKLLS